MQSYVGKRFTDPITDGVAGAEHVPELRAARREVTGRLTCADKAKTSMPPPQRAAFEGRINDVDRLLAPLGQDAEPESGGPA